MDRSIHCSIDLLTGPQSLMTLDSLDWRLEAFHNLKKIYCDETGIRNWLPDGFPSVHFDSLETLIDIVKVNYSINPENIDIDEFIERDEYSSVMETTVLNDLEEILSLCGTAHLEIVSSIPTEQLANGAICISADSGSNIDPTSYTKQGVYVIDLDNDKDLHSLQRGWYDDPIPDPKVPYSWNAFLSKTLPTSNATLITDRYVFQCNKEETASAELSTLLNRIIPDSFKGTYYVTVLFELDQLYKEQIRQELIATQKALKETRDDKNKAKKEGRWKDYKIKEKEEKGIIRRREEIKTKISDYIAQVLARISKCIIDTLKYKDVRLDFIAVKSPQKHNYPENYIGDFASTIAKWNNLHHLTHDRLIMTNFYWISATGAIAVNTEDYNTHTILARRQHIAFYTLFYGINNSDQKREYIPIKAMDQYLNDMFTLVGNAPSFAYTCYRFYNSESSIKEVEYSMLKRNPLIG